MRRSIRYLAERSIGEVGLDVELGDLSGPRA